MGRVLVIAHRPMLQSALHRIIGAWHHESLSTCDPMLGLELALTTHPDVVVVAHDWAVLGGGDLVRELREVLRDECPPILLIASGARRDRAVPVAWRGARATVVLHAPFRSVDLRDAIDRALPASGGTAARIASAALPPRLPYGVAQGGVTAATPHRFGRVA